MATWQRLRLWWFERRYMSKKLPRKTRRAIEAARRDR